MGSVEKENHFHLLVGVDRVQKLSRRTEHRRFSAQHLQGDVSVGLLTLNRRNVAHSFYCRWRVLVPGARDTAIVCRTIEWALGVSLGHDLHSHVSHLVV